MSEINVNEITAHNDISPLPSSWLQDFKQPSKWIPLLCLFLMWLMLLTPPTCPTWLTLIGNGQLDYSWQYCNGYFLQEGRRAGVDYVFPTGLLSYFYNYFWGSVYIGSLFWWHFLWQVATRSFFAYNLWRMCARYPDYRARALVFVACGFTLAITDDVFYTGLLLTISDALIHPQGYSSRRLALNVVFLTLCAYLKFTLLIYGLIIAALASWAHYAYKRPTFLSPLLLFIGAFLLFWLALGQHLTDLPLYFKNSLAVSSGYSAAMATQGSVRIAAIGLAELCLVAVWMVKFRVPYNKANVAGILVVAMFLLFLWKHGFVRNDPHAIFCFGSVLFFALVLPVTFRNYAPPSGFGRALLGSCIVLSFAGYRMVWQGNQWRHEVKELLLRPWHGASFALTPWRIKKRLDEDRLYEQNLWDLPHIRAIVKDASIDMFSYDQMALLLNGFNYQPRPVYQGYVAFSPYLIGLNERYMHGANRPSFMLFKLQTIDSRYPTLDDNRTLLELFRNYHPVETEKSYILLARNSNTAAPMPDMQTYVPDDKAASSSLSRLAIPLNQDVEINDGAAAHLLRIDVHPTLVGKLRSALIRPCDIQIAVTTDTGIKRAFRLIPEMTTHGFLLDPFLQSNEDVLRLYGQQKGSRVRKFRIQLATRVQAWVQNRVEVTLVSQPYVTSAHLQASQIQRLLAPERLAEPKR